MTSPSPSFLAAVSDSHQLSHSLPGLSSSVEAQWPFRGGVFHLDSRSALVKSMERAAKQQQLSDGYRAMYGEPPDNGMYISISVYFVQKYNNIGNSNDT